MSGDQGVSFRCRLGDMVWGSDREKKHLYCAFRPELSFVLESSRIVSYEKNLKVSYAQNELEFNFKPKK